MDGIERGETAADNTPNHPALLPLLRHQPLQDDDAHPGVSRRVLLAGRQQIVSSECQNTRFAPYLSGADHLKPPQRPASVPPAASVRKPCVQEDRRAGG